MEEAPKPAFWPCHFFLGDMLLNPERFVSGFLQYSRQALDDGFLTTFAATPPTLAGPHTESISPLPAEILAIRGPLPSLATTTADPTPAPNAAAECWPQVGPLEPGSWVAVVSLDWHTTRKTRKDRRLFLSWGYPAESLIGVPIVRYALLRVRRRIALDDDAAAGLDLEQLTGPDFVDVVGGVEAFLRETAPAVVGERVEETKRMLRARWRLGEWPNEDQPADLDMLTVLDDAAAREVFRDFLADAAHVRGNLTMAQAKGRSWYPGLAAPAPSTLTPVLRDDAVFRALDEKDAADGANFLGTQGRLSPPPIGIGPYRPREDKSSSWIYGPPVIKQLRWVPWD